MFKEIKTALTLFLLMVAITGFAYPAIVTGIASVLFPAQSAGSLALKDGAVIGSELIGQQFVKPEYFHPRPSLAGSGYDAMSSGASNLAPTAKKLEDDIASRQKILSKENPKQPVPVDLLTASASGLDPHISLEAANFQIPRIAKARKIKADVIEKFIEQRTEQPTFGIFGEKKVNVLLLNIDLDKK